MKSQIVLLCRCACAVAPLLGTCELFAQSASRGNDEGRGVSVLHRAWDRVFRRADNDNINSETARQGERPGEQPDQDEDKDEMVTDRPDFTESANVIPPGQIQVESGMTYARSREERSASYGETLVRAGVTKKMELRVGVPTYSIITGAEGRASGLEDASLGVKVGLREGNEEHFDLLDPKTAIIVDTALPVGSKAFREPHLQPGAKLCFAWPLTKRLGLSSNINYAYPSSGGVQFHQASASASVGYDLTDKVGLYAENYVFSREEPHGGAVNFVNVGATYALTDNHQLDARVGTATNGDNPSTFFGIGYSFRF